MQPQRLHSILPGEQFGLANGLVKSVSKDELLIMTESGLRKATTAVSCLVKAEPGDQVLVSESTQQCYILAILSRGHQDVELEFSGSVDIRLNQGAFKVDALNDIELNSAGAIQCRADEINQVSNTALIVNKKFVFNTERAHANCQQAEVHTGSLTHMVEQLVQHAKSVIRCVEGVENHTVGNLLKQIRNTFSLSSRNTVINARKDVKIDGERIHMG